MERFRKIIRVKCLYFGPRNYFQNAAMYLNTCRPDKETFKALSHIRQRWVFPLLVACCNSNHLLLWSRHLSQTTMTFFQNLKVFPSSSAKGYDISQLASFFSWTNALALVWSHPCWLVCFHLNLCCSCWSWPTLYCSKLNFCPPSKRVTDYIGYDNDDQVVMNLFQ